MIRIAAALLISLVAVPQFAQPVEMKLKITQVDTTARRKDTNFQYAATSGFSVTQVLGNYYLFGSTIPTAVWKSNGTEFWDLRFPPPPSDPLYSDWRPDIADDKKKCDPKKDPTVRDPRCGDASGLVWKTPNSSVPSWNYFDSRSGTNGKLGPFAKVGQWPYQWPYDYPKSGIPGMVTTVDAWKINQAIPNPVLPTSTPAGCTRDDWNPKFLATGAADSKVVHVNGKWYMGFCETINNPTTGGGWTANDLFNVLWATSSDGKTWSIKRILFRTVLETQHCGGGLLLTQLTVDNGYFYMLVNEIHGRGTLLLRALIDSSLPDGYRPWEIATYNAANPGRYLWKPTPPDGMLDTNLLQTMNVMPTIAFVKQAALTRVFTSTAPFSASRVIGVTVEDLGNGSPTMQVWSAPDFDTVMVKESTIDTAYIKPIAIWGWEFGFTQFPDHSSSTPRIAGNDFDFWLNGNFGSVIDGHTREFMGYRATATLSGGIFAPRGSFRTQASYYVSAASDNSINAFPQSIGLNERWVVIDTNGGSLQSGDPVYVQARNGLFLTNGGGTTLSASQTSTSTNETFFIEKKNGGVTTIANGDLVAFRAQSTGKYIIAALGGGSTVHNNGLDTNPNTRFVYVAN